ncbi:hypothetical protein WJX72_006020 [[Myrmecia] bisecta]|uniref:MYND-type domain-containing protein n=1 Tax=[Myrmecia] bisecta TaxID=41462 RepID=A0AAW1QF91_9CHLO
MDTVIGRSTSISESVEEGQAELGGKAAVRKRVLISKERQAFLDAYNDPCQGFEPDDGEPFNPDFELECANCEATAAEKQLPTLLKCGRCKIVYYCSKECQKTNWKIHKIYCKRA